ncbi:MAG: glutamyl-tRNA reductase [Firmicutes bacterium]|nr:glutamyl-tRNA reductase [Bacillota bacterium]
MPIIACGLSHKTAPVALREQVVFASDKIPFYLQDLVMNEGVKEAVLFSTCNRSEVYCHATDEEQVIDWFCRQHALERKLLEPLLYVYREDRAVQHIMQVACGLDSMVMGEPQILGQLKDAFSESCAAGTVATLFHRLFQEVFAVGKAVRTHTAIGACPVSISSSAMSLLKEHCQEAITTSTVLLIGAGDAIQLALRYLKTLQPERIIIVNRSIENARQLAKQYQAEVGEFRELQYLLTKADVVISATGSARPIVTYDMLSERRHPLFMIDIAIPRDVEEKIGEIKSITLKTIDDLVTVIQHNRHGREHAAEKAYQMISEKTQEFMIWGRALHEVSDTIRTYRNHVEGLCQMELNKAKKQLERGEDPASVLSSFAYALTNKLLHYPSVHLRQAGVEGRFDLLELTRQLFATSELKSELI